MEELPFIFKPDTISDGTRLTCTMYSWLMFCFLFSQDITCTSKCYPFNIFSLRRSLGCVRLFVNDTLLLKLEWNALYLICL